VGWRRLRGHGWDIFFFFGVGGGCVFLSFWFFFAVCSFCCPTPPPPHQLGKESKETENLVPATSKKQKHQKARKAAWEKEGGASIFPKWKKRTWANDCDKKKVRLNQ